MRRSGLGLGLVLMLGAGRALGQESPKQGLERFLGQMQQGRWEEAAAFIDPVTFASFLAQTKRNARAARRVLAGPPRDSAAVADQLAPAAAAAFARRQAELRAQYPPGSVSMFFERVGSVEELEALTSLEATARWLERHDLNAAYQAMMRNDTCTPPTPESIRQARPFEIEVLGVVVADDTSAYAVVRQRPGSAAAAPGSPLAPYLSLGLVRPQAWPIRRRPGGWRLEPDAIPVTWAFLRIATPPCPRPG